METINSEHTAEEEEARDMSISMDRNKSIEHPRVKYDQLTIEDAINHPMSLDRPEHLIANASFRSATVTTSNNVQGGSPPSEDRSHLLMVNQQTQEVHREQGITNNQNLVTQIANMRNDVMSRHDQEQRQAGKQRNQLRVSQLHKERKEVERPECTQEPDERLFIILCGQKGRGQRCPPRFEGRGSTSKGAGQAMESFRWPWEAAVQRRG